MQQVNLSTGFGVYYGKLSPFIPTKKHSFHGGLSFSLSTPIYLRQSFKHINESNFQYNLSNLNYLNYIDLQLKASFRYLYKINPKNYLGLLLSTTGILSNLNQASYLGTFSIGISYIYL
ncbi:hypothetical protein [Croceimicrobium sp.]|uniref:hypothetical protein n=1 Tax=Croceimicrobium sp. TaxID=2828340 RepID=UPI003BAB9159